MNKESNMRWYKLTPADGWFFRDSRPSNVGEDQSDLCSLFPPHPQTVVGGIRAALARSIGWSGGPWSDEIKRQLGNGFDDVSPLAFTPPLLARRNGASAGVESLYVTPQHVLGQVKTKNGKCVFSPENWLHPGDEPYATDVGEIVLPKFPKQSELEHQKGTIERLQSAEGFFVTARGLQQIIDGNLPHAEHLVHRDELFAFEHRIGIDRTPETRSMYSPGFVRLNQYVCLVIGVAGLDSELEVPPLFPLGGESRMAHCERLEQPPMQAVSNGGDLVLLVSPATFHNAASWYGAAPGESAERLSTSLTGNVVTCVVDRPVKIGGFDSRNTTRKQSLPLQPFASAGSVWWLDETNRLKEHNNFSLGARTSLGYGYALLGKQPS